MSLKIAANHLAAHGRGPDTTLVHMSPGEVKSLQQIAEAHGGSLSVNPHTGLPEAGFLSSILPLVAGAALGPAGVGLFESAGMAGLGIGALTGVATGSLSKGLMAGMGAYGGAGLMGGLTGAGEGALASQGIQAGMPQFAGDTAAYADQVNALRSAELAKAAQAPFMDKMSAGFSQVGSAPMDFLKSNLKYAAAATPSVIQAVSGSGSQMPAVQSDKNMGQRYAYEPGKLQGPYTASPTGVEQQYFNPQYRRLSDTEARNIYGYAEGGQVPAPGEPTKYSYDPLTQMFNKIESMPSDDQKKQMAQQQAQGGGQAKPMSDAAFAAQQAQGRENAEALGNMSMSAMDGLMGLLGQPPMAVQIAQSILGPNGLGIGIGSSPGAPGTGVGFGGTAASGMSGSGFTAGAPSGQSAANSGSGEGGMNAGGGGRGGFGGEGGGEGGGGGGEGGGFGGGGFGGGWAHGGGISSHLGDYSDGGRLLRGPGDGVSDSIPAQIGNKQPARLADGEFVVPARIVSELGNGSTEAGARKLYAMMDRVQKARGSTTGKGNVAKNSRADRYLPA